MQDASKRRAQPEIMVNMRVQRGEQLRAATPLFALLSDRRPWVDANLKETTLAHVTLGQRVDVMLDLYLGLIWLGAVASISPATGAELAILPRADAPPQRAGVTATISIETGRQRQPGDITSYLQNLKRGSAAQGLAPEHG